ncbi:MAG: InlB B-repeat-containing protein [bacterium]|nr:InlB B-repeat-containing protein [bacterium]
MEKRSGKKRRLRERMMIRAEKKIKRLGRLLWGLLILLAGVWSYTLSAKAQDSLLKSPYISFSPDGMAWTTDAGKKDIVWYPNGTAVHTGIKSELAKTGVGEHYYEYERTGNVPVSVWKVAYREGQCIHSTYPSGDYHNIAFGRQICFQRHYSGWNGYCADCGELISGGLIYMSKETAESIRFIQIQDGFDYYYLCPFCRNLEQGFTIRHYCKDISANRYRVVYDANHTGTEFEKNGILEGVMSPSIHMYGNAKQYEGKEVTPVTHLTLNAFSRTGYRFVGWNTRPDGSGESFSDGQEILNLTAENWDGRETDAAGTVTLYAQWALSESILQIDPNQGSYNGKQEITQLTGGYGTVYSPDPSLLIPPEGYRVSFVCGGGTSAAPVRTKMHFVEWSMVQPFRGTFSGGGYRYRVPGGTVDTLRARYASDSIVLPLPQKEGFSFGGWYYDEDCVRPAGGAGDSFTPTEDVTLYAQWVELILQARDNYDVNEGAGAVNLSWSQADGNGKTYRIYQSRNGTDWVRINAVDDIGNERSVDRQFGFSGGQEQYVVPYGGIYTISLSGAQGGGSGGFSGGKGGSVTASFYLYQGEILTVTVGGQNGYNGGGKAQNYGVGGGMTCVESDRKGLLLTAGGGGGATALFDGYPGGSEAGLLPSGSTGQNGASGGGGGYRGGISGELIYHDHCGQPGEMAVLKNGEVIYVTDTCLHTHTGNSTDGGGCYGIREEVSYQGNCRVAWYIANVVTYADGCSALLPDGTRCNKGWTWTHYKEYHECDASARETQLYVCTAGHRGWTNGETGNYTHTGTFRKTVFRRSCAAADREDGWTAAECKYGLSDHQVLSAKPSYGGGSYVNTAYAISYEMTAGVRQGDGQASVKADLIGFQDVPALEGVSAPDLEAPLPVEESAVEKVPLEGKKVLIRWQEPEDRGTDYYHRAETCLQGSASVLCVSNVTKNTLISGVKGYRYVLDEREDTSAEGGVFIRDRSVTVEIGDGPRYLHLAAVDTAGNISDTVHVKLEPGNVRWNLFTRQLEIALGDNVCAAGEKMYYVKCDGATPFTLLHGGYTDGIPTEGYQLNYTVYESEIRGEMDSLGEMIIFTPSGEEAEKDAVILAQEQTWSVRGTAALGQYPYSVARRKAEGRELESEQMFTLNGEYNGKYVEIRPRSGAEYEEDGIKRIQYSDPEADAANALLIIGDGEGPVIRGLECLQDGELINRLTEDVVLHVTAQDELSGVEEFYLKVVNEDNYSERVCYPENGVISLEITVAEPLFSGDFTVTGYAVDKVGNVTETVCSITEFALETSVERILEPHDPVFKCGESGILSVTTYGYADRVEVEFPEELLAMNPGLNRCFEYTDKEYRQESRLQFMVPLYVGADQYTVKVSAYKDGRRLDSYSDIGITVGGGSVLSEFRTRLR